jgi:cysteine desulfurase
LKQYLHDQLVEKVPGVSFNVDPFGKSLYNLLSVNFPKNEKTEMILFNLDMDHICASGGSACSSGAQQGSHVIHALNKGTDIVTVRFSFSKHNTKAEIDQVITALLTMLN